MFTSETRGIIVRAFIVVAVPMVVVGIIVLLDLFIFKSPHKMRTTLYCEINNFGVANQNKCVPSNWIITATPTVTNQIP